MTYKQCPNKDCNHTFVSRYDGEKQRKNRFYRMACGKCKKSFFIQNIVEAEIYTLKDYTAKMKKRFLANDLTDRADIKSIHKSWNLEASSSMAGLEYYSKRIMKLANRCYVTKRIYTLPTHEYLNHPEALDLFNKMPVRMKEFERVISSNFLVAEIDNGNWAMMDSFHFFALEDEANALINWKTGVKATIDGNFVKGGIELGIPKVRKVIE